MFVQSKQEVVLDKRRTCVVYVSKVVHMWNIGVLTDLLGCEFCVTRENWLEIQKMV